MPSDSALNRTSPKYFSLSLLHEQNTYVITLIVPSLKVAHSKGVYMSVSLTRELFNTMQPPSSRKVVVQASSIPTQGGNKETGITATWNNNDDNWIIEANMKTRQITGHFYDWNEETQDWDNAHDVAMTDEQILNAIKTKKLIFA